MGILRTIGLLFRIQHLRRLKVGTTIPNKLSTPDKMKSHLQIAAPGRLLLAFIVVFSILWVLVFANSFNLPLYLDSLFTIGAGAKLADQGHFSDTFMLYGLVNPYILEALLFFKLGALAPYGTGNE